MMEQAISDWINACPYACQSYIDESGNVIVTVEAEEKEE